MRKPDFAQPLKLDGVDSDNIEILGNRLAAINQKARTEDDYMKIGTLLDFRILVRTEKSYDGDTQVLHNKFMVEGLDGIKYTYNNGYIAKDPKLAVMNFINALERIPGMIEKREKKMRSCQRTFRSCRKSWRPHGPKREKSNGWVKNLPH